jgi:putative spermidine/putrescine transport system substrate-binding protein
MPAIDLDVSPAAATSRRPRPNLWLKLLPTFADRFPASRRITSRRPSTCQGWGQGFGVVNYYPSGPLIEYAPER